METGQGVWEDVGAPWMGLSVGGARCLSIGPAPTYGRACGNKSFLKPRFGLPTSGTRRA